MSTRQKIEVGSRVIAGGSKKGTVRFIGETQVSLVK